ncbi:putative odorant receptor 92a [Colletes latitarsis]|uniref:putative odorant receptor 92a n=1 Tax=Colletes latitarsis TaxID=2605962 RepID=UPI0040365C05
MATITIISYPVKFGLLLIGVWPKSSQKILKRVLWTIALGISLSSQFWYCASYSQTESLPDLLDNLSVILSDLVTFIKLIVIWFNYRLFSDILTIVFEDWNNLTLTERNKHVMVDKAILASRISKFFLGVYSMTCILYAASTLLFPDDTGEELTSNEKKLLFKMKFPFETTSFPIYEIILITQFVLEYSIAVITSMLIALFAALVLHVGSQIDIICEEIMEFSNYYAEERPRAIKNLITKHQRIICLSENIKVVFTYVSLVQFLANILAMCFLGFILLYYIGTEEGPTIITRWFPYYVTVNCEAFVLCYTGEYLSSKSQNISKTVYSMLWYKLNTRESRIILLLLLRAQKKLTLTAGKFVELSLETFTNMIKASASYASILLAVY